MINCSLIHSILNVQKVGVEGEGAKELGGVQVLTPRANWNVGPISLRVFKVMRLINATDPRRHGLR